MGASAVVALALPAAAAPAPLEVGTWGASPVAGANLTNCPAGDGGVVNQTVRNVVFTSVAGSEVRVLELFQAGVVQGNVTVAVGVLSYAGQLNFTILGDADAVPDLKAFTDGLRDALTQLGPGQQLGGFP